MNNGYILIMMWYSGIWWTDGGWRSQDLKPVLIDRYFNFAHSDRADSEDFGPWESENVKKVTEVYTWVTFLKFLDPQRPKSSKSALSLCAKLKYLWFNKKILRISTCEQFWKIFLKNFFSAFWKSTQNEKR